MRFRTAQKLHNDDEVKVKKTGEVVRVVTKYNLGNMILIEVIPTSDGRTFLYHDEVC